MKNRLQLNQLLPIKIIMIIILAVILQINYKRYLKIQKKENKIMNYFKFHQFKNK